MKRATTLTLLWLNKLNHFMARFKTFIMECHFKSRHHSPMTAPMLESPKWLGICILVYVSIYNTNIEFMKCLTLFSVTFLNTTCSDRAWTCSSIHKSKYLVCIKAQPGQTCPGSSDAMLNHLCSNKYRH